MKSRLHLWSVLALIAVCLSYLNSFHNGFHFDDFHTVVDNPSIRSLHNLPHFFTDATTFSVLPANRTYRPFVSASLAIDYAMGHGYVPLWFHAGVFLLYLAQLAAMYFFFAQLLRKTVPMPSTQLVALAATAWYGLHPAMAETVNYIIQRGDLFSTFGVVAAMAIYACSQRLRYLYFIPLAFALLSKPPAVVFPALLLSYILFFEPARERPWRDALMRAVPSLALCAGLIWLQSAMTPKTYAPGVVSSYSYIITQPFVLMRYFGSFFLPLHLNVDSELRAFDGFPPEAVLGFVFLASLFGAIWITARRSILRPISFGLIWFLVASLPTSLYRLSEVENDHRMFMPFVGLALAVTWSLYLIAGRAAARFPSLPIARIAGIGFIAAMCLYARGTYLRNRVWLSEETLWLDDVQKSPANGRGLMNYGLSQMEKGNYPVAASYFERALSFTPDYPTLEVNLGIVYGALADPVRADAHFLRAISLAPGNDEAHFYYGRWLEEAGRLPEALQQLNQAVRLNPARLAGRDLLVKVLVATGDLAKAREIENGTLALDPTDHVGAAFIANAPTLGANYWIDVSLHRFQEHDYTGCIEAAQQALKLNPEAEIAYNNIGAAHAALFQWDAAIESEEKALALKPGFELAKNNLASYQASRAQAKESTFDSKLSPEDLLNQSLQLYRAGRYQESMNAANAALERKPNFAEAWNNIAAVHASLGQWDDAIFAAKNAVRLKPDFQLAKNNLAWALSEKAKAASHGDGQH